MSVKEESIQVSKFLLVGVINTLVGAGLMFVLYNAMHFSYWISSAANYIVGGIISFFLNKYFTFKNYQKSIFQIFIFILLVIFCYFISYYFAKKIIYVIMKNYSETVRDNASMFGGMCLYTIFNYIGQKFFVFSRG